MKRTIVVAVALAFVLLSAGAALAAITGSKHDMRTHLTVDANSGYDEVCVYCHTPHSASMSAQLWNHTATQVAAYTAYTSSTMNATGGGQPGTGSLLCLSCHDGTVAVDAMVNTPNYPGADPTNKASLNGDKTILSGSKANFGTDFSNDHPIGINYDAALIIADPMFNTVASLATGSNQVRLINGKVECATCHDAHNTSNMPFLRTSNAGSLMCLKCHIK